MAKCPKCKKEIWFLNHFESGEAKYKVWLEDSNLSYEQREFIGNGQTNDYECPECLEFLGNTEEEAIKVLEGEEDD